MTKEMHFQRLGSFMLILIFCLDTTVYPLFSMYQNRPAQHNTDMSYLKVSESNFLEQDGQGESSDGIDGVEIALGGPGQPEFSNFTPVGLDDMVNPFTGDFTYNIPLMDVEGYPINMAYDANVDMNSESSWVGLGWSLNLGSINRNLRGVPDDFNGTEEIEVEQNVKPEFSISVGGNFGFELFGFGEELTDAFSSNNQTQQQFTTRLNLGLSLKYNNYNGFNSTASIGPSFTLAKESKENGGLDRYNLSLGISGSSQEGAYFNPQFSISRSYVDEGGKYNNNFYKNFNLGSSFSSRSGWQSVSYGFNVTSLRNNTEFKGNRAMGQNVSSATSGTLGASHDLMQSTYFPSIAINKINLGLTFSVKGGIDAVGADPSYDLSGSVSYMDNIRKEDTRPVFGYMYLQKGQKNKKAILDFNRENEGSFTETTKALGVPVLTYDIFSVNAQGLMGSYIPFRSEIGYVFDPIYRNNTTSGSIGGELGLGGMAKAGLDISAANINVSSGVWDRFNKVNEAYSFDSDKVNFLMAGEGAMKPNLDEFNAFGGDDPVFLEIKRANASLRPNFRKGETTSQTISELPKSKGYFSVTNQPFTVLTHAQIKSAKDAGLRTLYSQHNNTYRNDHHIGEVRVVNGQGQRFIFGLAVYNVVQKDYVFAVGSNKTQNALKMDNLEKLQRKQIEYNDENTRDNKKGTDHYFQKKVTPAYASSFLVTEILSPDYIDNDDVAGPSENDYGTYQKFSYTYIGKYKWRNPVAGKRANFQEGMYAHSADDKASYTYGEKELWYVDRITSKNYVAVFHISPRKDGWGVEDEEGNLESAQSAVRLQQLDSISLYNKVDFDANGFNTNPIKRVIFTYDNSLCQNYDNNELASGSQSGKLTLLSIQFKFEGSSRSMQNGYEFNYSSVNPEYQPAYVDRWGNYKQWEAPITINDNIEVNNLHPMDFPYVKQDDLSTQNLNASAWKLTEITLPSKGTMTIDYEADQYAYVQNRRAMRMFSIVGKFVNGSVDTSNDLIDLSDNQSIAVYLGSTTDPSITTNEEHFIKGLDNLRNKDTSLVYFRTLSEIREANNNSDPRYDFVPGFGQVDWINNPPFIHDQNQSRYIIIPFAPVNLKKNGNGTDVNPIISSSIQFARLYLNNYIPPGIQNLDENGFTSAPLDFIKSLGGAFESYKELFTGPNQGIYNEGDVCRSIVKGHSYVRLFSSNPNKIGGGYRVKQITVSDSWGSFFNDPSQNHVYGKVYEYVGENGLTSGVATYEPLAGGDENPFRQPVFYSYEYLGAPSIENYQMEPFGETYFPSAQVGYSRVVVRNLERSDITSNATGHEVFEYFTSKDFPTIVKYSAISDKDGMKSYDQITRNINAVFFSRSSDKASVSQGFVVENNNMNGKMKSHITYGYNPIGEKIEISSVYNSYLTQSFPEGQPMAHQVLPIGLQVPVSYKLKNEVTMIDNKGTQKTGILGFDYDVFMDFRQSVTGMNSGSFNTNLNTIPFLGIPIFLGQYSNEKTKFRSAVVMKTINRYGVLRSVKSSSIGKLSTSTNLAYDYKTGEVVLASFENEFDDLYYSLKYPAHWFYDQMGQAYVSANTLYYNLGNQEIAGGVIDVGNANFEIGDEVLVVNGTSSIAAWVLKTNMFGKQGNLLLVDKNGHGINSDFGQLLVLRSGNRNMQSATMMSLITQSNPLNTLSNNGFQKVLESSAIEYSDVWRRKCACSGDLATVLESNNPYFTGERGRWQAKTTYAYLTSRTQTFENKNSDIRNDGFYSSYSPFYINNGNGFGINKNNWTFSSQLLDINKNGGGIQSNDAINIYGSSLSAFNRSRVSAMSANGMIREIGYDGFEDNYPGKCIDSDFYFDPTYVTSSTAHTGSNSLRAPGNTPVVLERELVEECNENYQCDLTITTANSTQSGYSNVKSVYPDGTYQYLEYTIKVLEGEIEFESFENGVLKVGSNQPFIIQVVYVNEKGCNAVKIIQ